MQKDSIDDQVAEFILAKHWLYVIHLTSAPNPLHGYQHSVVRSSTEHSTENLLPDKNYTLTW